MRCLKGREELRVRHSVVKYALASKASRPTRCAFSEDCTRAIDHMLRDELELLGTRAFVTSETINVLKLSEFKNVYHGSPLCNACREALLVQDHKNIVALLYKLPVIFHLGPPMADDAW